MFVENCILLVLGYYKDFNTRCSQKVVRIIKFSHLGAHIPYGKAESHIWNSIYGTPFIIAIDCTVTCCRTCRNSAL